MKFKSEVLTQASGSIGGVTYAHNRGGLYRRARSIPTNPNSDDQIIVRNYFSSLAVAWRDTLTPAQRDAWSDYAANSPVTDTLGDPLLLTGQQMYIRCNSVRLRAGAARVDDGPVLNGLIDLTTTGIVAAVGAGTVLVNLNASDPWANDDDGGLVVQTSRWLPPTINFHRSPFRYLGVIAGDSTTPPTPPVVISTANAYGQEASAAVTGQRIFGRFTAFAGDGRISVAKSYAGYVL